MPRVSQEHRDARRQQILDAARVCFVRNGFHATSMQDVFREAGLSAGAVYRYFRGKDELIGEIARTKINDVLDPLDDVSGLAAADLPPLDELLGRVFASIRAANERDGTAKLVGQVASEAIRSPAVAEVMRENVGTALARFGRLAERYQQAGALRADVPPERIARAMAALVQGFMLQLTLYDTDGTVEDFRLGVRGLLGGDVPSLR